MPKKERDPLFIEMFRTAKPFEEGAYYKSETYQELQYKYAYWDIELQKRCDSDLREVKEQLVTLRASMETYRDYHYFVQGIDRMIEYLLERIPALRELMEEIEHSEEEDETTKGPLL